MVWTGDSCGQCGSKNLVKKEKDSAYPPWHDKGIKAIYFECKDCGAIWPLDAAEAGYFYNSRRVGK